MNDGPSVDKKANFVCFMGQAQASVVETSSNIIIVILNMKNLVI